MTSFNPVAPQDGGASADADRAGALRAEPSVPLSQAKPLIPCADLLAEINSERVINACAAAKAVPGDVWGQGAEGHYAFLCGLAALLNLPSEELARMSAESSRRRAWWRREHPDHPISDRCPTRVLYDLGFTASAIPSRRADDAEGGSAGTEGSAVPEGQTPITDPNPGSPS